MSRRERQEQYVEIPRGWFYGILLAAALVALVGAIFLGRAYTPDPPRVIGWSDWQARKVARRYGQELAQLREDLGKLAHMLGENPDPVDAELAASRLEQRSSRGLGLLTRERDAVIGAAQAVRDWAAGYASYEYAVGAVNAAIEIVGKETPDGEWTGGHDLGHEEVGPTATPTPWWTDSS